MKGCQYCESSVGRVIVAKKDYPFFLCNSCHSISRIFPKPDLSIYSQSYYGSDETEKTWLTPLQSIFEIPRKRRAKYAAKFLSENSMVLDIGCGNGKLLDYVHSYAKASCVGIEPGQSAFKRSSSNRNIKVVKSDFDSFHNQSLFSFVFSVHNFEHIDSAKSTLEKTLDLLTDGGRIFFVFPNAASWQFKLFKQHWLHLDPPFHLHIPHRQYFIKLMSERGFELVHERHFNAEQNVPGFIQSFLNVFSKRKDLLFYRLKNRKSLIKVSEKIHFLYQMLWAFLLLPFAYLECLFSSLFRRGATIELVFQQKK